MKIWMLVVMMGIGITDDGGANMYHIEDLTKTNCEQMKAWVNSAHTAGKFGGKAIAECFIQGQ